MSNLKQQASIQSQFVRQVNFCKKIPTASNVFELSERLKDVTNLYNTFKEVQSAIEDTCAAETINDQYAVRGQIEEFYYKCVSELKATISKLQPSGSSSGPSGSSSSRAGGDNDQADIKLPRITIPKFSGVYTEWPSFKDLFESLFHNNAKLQRVQKFHYLKENLEGEAASLIESLHTTDANYDEAWTCINDRYNHNRTIIDCHFKSLYSIQPIIHEDSTALKKLLDTTTKIMKALGVLGEPIQHWNSFIVYWVASRLDKETRRQWKLILKKDSKPTFKQLSEFIESRWRSLEADLPST